MSLSARLQILDLNDEFGSNRILKELVQYLSEADCKDFVDHVFRMWDLRSEDVPV